MSQPTARDVHVDAPLSNVSVAYIQDAMAFVAHRVFPVVPVDKQSDKYFTYTQADWFRDEAQIRGDASESAGTGFGVSTANYNCDVWAQHVDVGDQTLANADSPLDPESDAARLVAQRLLLKREIVWASDYMAGSVWGTNVTGGSNFTKWSTYADSDPITDFETGKSTILQNTGFEPNTIVLGYNAFRYLKRHPDIVDLFKYTSNTIAAGATEQILASIFGVDNVYVCKAIKNTANEGGTASYSFVQSNNAALLCYVNPTPSIRMPSAGYTFVWRGVSDGLGLDIGTRRIDLPLMGKRAFRVESEMAWDNKLVASNLGYYFTTAV